MNILAVPQSVKILQRGVNTYENSQSSLDACLSTATRTKLTSM